MEGSGIAWCLKAIDLMISHFKSDGLFSRNYLKGIECDWVNVLLSYVGCIWRLICRQARISVLQVMWRGLYAKFRMIKAKIMKANFSLFFYLSKGLLFYLSFSLHVWVTVFQQQ